MTLAMNRASVTAAGALFALTATWAAFRKWRRNERTKWIAHETDQDEEQIEELPSILDYFKDLSLDVNSSIENANKKRTAVYYGRARDAHLYDLCPGVRSYPRLRNRREEEMNRIMKYYHEGTKSHRTVLAMCDVATAEMLDIARQRVLEPLDWSHDIRTDGVWIPEQNFIPKSDLHVTIATPWWWHTMEADKELNTLLNQELVGRLKQALVSEFHHPFQLELERIILVGQSLLALWRCVGERRGPDGSTIYDRHGEAIDPVVKLRRDIVRCFTTSDFGEPLTYAYRKSQKKQEEAKMTPNKNTPNGEATPIDRRAGLKRQNTIEFKTPGLGNGDGFIHTTLARLPLKCLSMKDVELAPLHRLAREATATYCGHRMVVSKFRFLETTGAGGESNPCIDPLFDATIESPRKVELLPNGYVEELVDLHTAQKVADRSSTIGAPTAVIIRKGVVDVFPDTSVQAT